VVTQLKDKGFVSRGWIGVQIQPLTTEIAEGLGMKGTEGALVDEAQVHSPAAKAGILSGDIITTVNGHAVKDAHGLAKQIGALAPGAEVKLGIWRKGEEKTFSLTLGELPKSRKAAIIAPDSDTSHAGLPKLGLSLAPASGGSDGVVVTGVDPNGPASEQGLKTGDVILEVGGSKVANAADVRKAIGDAQKSGKQAVIMRVKSDDKTKFVAVPFAHA
jgi:serine protease Do